MARKAENHPLTVEGFDGTLKKLAQRVCRMRYDKVQQFIGHCADEFDRQEERECEKGRVKIASRLIYLIQNLEDARTQLQGLYYLSKPHTQRKKAKMRKRK